MPLRVKNKVIQVLRGKNLLIYISACYMVTPARTADFFLWPKEDIFFPFKNTFFFPAGRNILKTNIFILSGNLKQWLFFPTHEK